MTGVAQGINKLFAYKKQTGRGTPAAGNGGQLLRRETATMSRSADTYTNNEIVSHQQDTGATQGVKRSSGTLSGVLSGGTYMDHLGSLLRKNAVATTNIANASLTIALVAGLYNVTRAAGSFLTDGIKFGDVIRVTGMNAANNNVNLLVLSVTALTLKTSPLNQKTLTPEGPIANAGVTIAGKKVWAPISGHTNDYYTFEEWFSDISSSLTYPDVQIATATIGMPATGNVTFSETFVGLGKRVKGNAQVLTTPTPETTSSVVASVAGAVVVNGKRQMSITSATINIDGSTAPGEATMGSDSVSDTQKGRIKVSGTFTGLYEDDTLGQPFDDGSAIGIAFAVADDGTDNADFVSFALPRVKLFSDDADDGETQIVRTYNFTAEINSAGGPALESFQTILQIHDSLA
jgi:hypothetical protein